jgi:hypothetical protein
MDALPDDILDLGIRLYLRAGIRLATDPEMTERARRLELTSALEAC